MMAVGNGSISVPSLVVEHGQPPIAGADAEKASDGWKADGVSR